jgi:periplasmic protein TonB
MVISSVLMFLATPLILPPPAAAPEIKHPYATETSVAKYTEEARAAKLEGIVVLEAEIGTDGRAHDIRVVSGLGHGLDESAVEALRQWKFKPGTKDGTPTAMVERIPISFWRRN